MMDTAEHLHTLVSEAVLDIGVQLWASNREGTTLDIAVGVDGLGSNICVDSVQAAYCSLKPVAALCVGVLVAEREMSWDDKIGDILDWASGTSAGAASVDSILTHTSGLFRPQALEALIESGSRRHDLVRSTEPPPGWRSDQDAAYSEYVGWYLLQEIVETLSGQNFGEFALVEVLDPLGVADDIWIDRGEQLLSEASSRLRVNAGLSGARVAPLLEELAPSRACIDHSAAAGGYGSAAGLGGLYQRILRAIDEDGSLGRLSAEMLRTMVSPQRGGERYDHVLGRPCEFGYGFMVDLRSHRFGRNLSPISFGHAGLASLSWGFADPASGIAAACFHHGLIDAESAIGLRRESVVRHLLDELTQDTVGCKVR